MMNTAEKENNGVPTEEEREAAKALWRAFDSIPEKRRTEIMEEIDRVEASGGVVKRLEGASVILYGRHTLEGGPEKSIADMGVEELVSTESEMRSKLHMLANIPHKEEVGLGMLSWELKRYFEERLEKIKQRMAKR